MEVPDNLLNNHIKEKNIYYFLSEQINSPEPHYFVCLKITDDKFIILSCCTSQFEKKKRYIERMNLPYETLVWIPQDDNPFKKDTYINCNSANDIKYSLKDFIKKYENNLIKYRVEISDEIFEQIMIGIQKSPELPLEFKELFLSKE